MQERTQEVTNVVTLVGMAENLSSVSGPLNYVCPVKSLTNNEKGSL